MGRNFGVLPSDLLGIVDRTVAFDVNVAATVALTDYDRDLSEMQANETYLAFHDRGTGAPRSEQVQAETKWDVVERFD